MASWCCYKEVYRYPHNNYNFPYSTCIRSFFGSSILTSLFILKCFFGLVSVIFLQYIANVTHRTFEIVQKKSRSREYKNYLNERRACVDGARARASPETSTCEVRNQVRMTFD